MNFGLRYFEIARSVQTSYSESASCSLRLSHVVCKKQCMLSEDEFCFLNIVDNAKGVSNTQSASPDLLWLYNLHYFDDLNAEDASDRQALH